MSIRHNNIKFYYYETIYTRISTVNSFHYSNNYINLINLFTFLIMKIPTILASKISLSKKEFLFFDLNGNNKITNVKLTNDYKRYKNQYDKVRVISTIKNDLKYTTI